MTLYTVKNGMQFSVDAHAIGRHLTGNEVYIRNLLRAFAALDHTSEFVAFISVDQAARWVPERFETPRVSANPFMRLGFDLARQLRRLRPHLLHVQYTAPLACPVPVVVSVHDVSYLEHPEFFPFPRALQLRCTVERTVRSAARILTPSEFSRRAIAKAYGLDPERIAVVPNGVSSTFRPVARETALARVQARFGIPGPYILTVGDLQPRKNQAGLIQAFEELLRESPQLPHRLVLVGKETFLGSAVRKTAQQSRVADRIHFTGFVDDDELLDLYAGCELFVFPSFYEGFGMPIVEAMACGRAVACSNASAMPEVADAAALLFDAHSIGQMTRAMRDLILDHELRARMERLGLARASLFSWEQAVQKTLDVYYEVADCGSRLAERAASASVSRP